MPKPPRPPPELVFLASIPVQLRELVRQRAGDRCEYCHSTQVMSAFFRLQMEHIVARQHEGGSVEGNLALGCQHCNLRKGTNLTGIDPETGNITRLFNPRLDIWNEHFRVAGPLLLGQTAIGRTTVRLLDMNSDSQRDLRKLNPLE